MTNPLVNKRVIGMNKHLIWAVVIILVVAMICVTIMYASSHPYVLRFEIDNNTVEAVKSINYTAISRSQS